MIKQKVELLHRSSQRMMDSMALPRDDLFWVFLKKEVWVHVKRTLELWWYVFRKKYPIRD